MAGETVHHGSNLESTGVSQAAQVETRSARVPRTALRTLAIVPALNEEDAVGDVVDELRAFDPEIEILVIDDGSVDGTALVARRHGARVVRLPFNLGIGGAMQTGFRYAFQEGFDAAVQVDGDGQHDPAELSKLLVPLRENRADIIVGSRFAGERSYRAPFFRRIGIALFARTISLIARQKVTDTTSGFRAMNRHGIALFAADYPHDYPEVEATVMVVRHELRLLEVPVAMRDRAAGRSSITASQSVYYMAKVLLAIFVSLFRRNVVPLKEDH
jgi:glycosyltransferase involved in cell wall biosynthesis